MDFRSFVIRWNNNFPLDYWWRKKHNIPFGSLKHLEQSFVNMRIEYEEERLIEEFKKRKEEEDENVVYDTGNEETNRMLNKSNPFSKGKEKIIKLDKEELDEEFDNLDISKISGNETSNT